MQQDSQQQDVEEADNSSNSCGGADKTAAEGEHDKEQLDGDDNKSSVNATVAKSSSSDVGSKQETSDKSETGGVIHENGLNDGGGQMEVDGIAKDASGANDDVTGDDADKGAGAKSSPRSAVDTTADCNGSADSSAGGGALGESEAAPSTG